MAFAYLPQKEKVYIKKKLEIDNNPATNLNIEIFELTDNKYEAIKRLTNRPEMNGGSYQKSKRSSRH